MSQTSRSHYVHVEVGCRESKVRPADRTLASLIFALPWALPGEGRAWVASRKPRVYCLSNPVASFWPRAPVLPDPHLLYPLVVPPPSQMFSGQSIQTQNWCPLGNFCLPPHPLQRAVCSRENNYIWRQIISGQGLGSARPYRGNEVSKPQVMTMVSADPLLPLPTPHTSISDCHPTLHPGTWFSFPLFLALQIHYISAAHCPLPFGWLLTGHSPVRPGNCL